MPLQKKKKKKPKAQKEKTPAVSQKVTQIVRVNVGDVKPKPRRRRAPAKKPAQPFGFGGGGGSGLAQVVQAPQATQDVLQQSKELREIVNKLQTSPAQLTLMGSEQGGQSERAIMPDDEPVSRGQFKRIMGEFIGYQGDQMTLAGERLDALNQSVHALSQPPEPPVTELHEPAPTPTDTIVEPSVTTPIRMGRGKARTAEQNQSDLDKWAASGLSQKEFAQQEGISFNTLATLARPHGGIKAYRRSKGIATKKGGEKASETSDSGEETDFP